jgi:hypothetical protein
MVAPLKCSLRLQRAVKEEESVELKYQGLAAMAILVELSLEQEMEV